MPAPSPPTVVKPAKAATPEDVTTETLTHSLIKNLRHLNLHKNEVTPSFSASVFSSRDKAQNRAQRIRTAEWIMYKLCELYSPKETQLKLQPHFPSILQRQSQRQSLDLRAALFKWIDDLKKRIMLPKDMIWRRTMLDECKGEKFVYALYCYSCLVLTTTVVGDPLDGSITRQILNRKLGDAHERVEPLVLAYRTSLTALLKRRGELADKYMSFENILFEKEEEHGRASDEFEKLREGSDQRLLSERTLQKVEDKLATEWAGNVAWVDILLYGDQNPPDNGLLERDFDGEVWPRAINGTVDQILPQTSTSLLQSLETRLDEQNQRLAKWKQIKEDLVAATATPIKSPQKNFLRSPTKTPSRSPSKSARKLPPGAPASGHQRTQSATDHNMFTKQDSSLTTPRRTPFFKHPIKPNLEPISTPSLPPRQHVRSLSERTRMSIMRMSPEKGLKDPHDQTKVELLRNLSSLPTAEIPVLGQMDSIAESISTSEPMPDPAVEVPTNQIPDRYAALAERTRLSMLSAAKIQRRPSMKPRQSKVYPVNQWEDSSRTQSLTDVMEEVSLHKKLPGMDADYESVFASRPKIGLGIPGESSFVFGGGYGDEDGSHG